jgi:hypothetical protein
MPKYKRDPAKKLEPVPAASGCSPPPFQNAVIEFIEVPTDKGVFRIGKESAQNPAG